MKYRFFIAAAVALAIGACKTPYRATDQPRTTTDSTASLVDTSSTMNQMSNTTDSVNKVADSTSMDTSMRQIPDSAKMSSAMDTAAKQPVIDSARTTPQTDSMQSQAADSSTATRTDPGVADSAAAATTAPAAIEPVFTKQYPGASDAQWSAYDSLAAVPIDMRLTGWKKMSNEDHMVKFNYKDKPYYAWYDSQGKWIGSTTTLDDVNELPAAVKTALNNAIKTRYAGYVVSQVNLETQPGKKAYEVELSKDESKVRMMVTSAGKINQIYRYTTEKK